MPLTWLVTLSVNFLYCSTQVRDWSGAGLGGQDRTQPEGQEFLALGNEICLPVHQILSPDRVPLHSWLLPITSPCPATGPQSRGPLLGSAWAQALTRALPATHPWAPSSLYLPEGQGWQSIKPLPGSSQHPHCKEPSRSSRGAWGMGGAAQMTCSIFCFCCSCCSSSVILRTPGLSQDTAPNWCSRHAELWLARSRMKQGFVNRHSFHLCK